MTPSEGTPVTTTDENLSTPVQLALLNQRVGLVIDSHDKRITALERWREGRGKSAANIVASVASVVAIVVTIAAALQWR